MKQLLFCTPNKSSSPILMIKQITVFIFNFRETHKIHILPQWHNFKTYVYILHGWPLTHIAGNPSRTWEIQTRSTVSLSNLRCHSSLFLRNSEKSPARLHSMHATFQTTNSHRWSRNPSHLIMTINLINITTKLNQHTHTFKCLQN